MANFLLELYSEEIPALMQKKAQEAYKEIFAKTFKDNNINFDRLEVFISPCRLTIYSEGLPITLPATHKEVKGPKTTSPENVISAFCNAHGITAEKLEIKEDAVKKIVANKAK